jgi:choline dehydrogenase
MPADVAIVGAGSAGGVLAARLSENPDRSVLLLEAGPDFGSSVAAQPPDIADANDATATAHDWGHDAAPGRLRRRIPLYAGRVVGGSSATNNVFALRGQPADYDRWAMPGWSFDDILPSFRRLERDLDFDDDWHGRTGPVPIRRHAQLTPIHRAFLDASVAAGHPSIEDHNRPDSVGAGRLPVNEVDGVRQSVAITYLRHARERRNLTIRSGAIVDRVALADGRATGVTLADGEHVRAEHVILAAGGYGSPAILLRSDIGPGGRVDLPGVGRNLHDHPLLRLRYATRATPTQPARQSLLTTGDIQLFPSGPIPGPDGPEVGLFVSLMRPRSRGRLRLGSRDPHDPPRIDPRHVDDPHDLARLVEAVRLARRVAATPPLADLLDAELSPGPSIAADEEIAAAVLAEVASYQHPVGTCRMGPPDDAEAVVDPTGSVHGVERLSVVDASIMPAIPSANTNLPTMMVAERLAGAMTPPRRRAG